MTRLPTPGSDEGQWGDILNDYLAASHKSDGSLKDAIVTTTNLAPGSVTSTSLANNAVTAANLAPDAVTTTTIQDGTITETLLDPTVQSKLNSGGGGPGATGATGPQGQPGATGAQGTPGLQGTQGFTGPAGVTGATGSQGATGPTGTAGTNGATGATGPSGTAGGNGATGATGAQGATGPAGATTIAGISGLQGALDGKVAIDATLSTTPTVPQLRRNLTYTLDVGNPNLAEIAIAGVVKSWSNEWGAIRGTSPYNWGDSLVRAIRSTGDGISDGTGSAGSGRALELVDRRIASPPNITTSEHLTPSNGMLGVRWKDGRMVQGGNMVGAVYVLNSNQTAADIPASLPAGTLIVRKRAA